MVPAGHGSDFKHPSSVQSVACHPFAMVISVDAPLPTMEPAFGRLQFAFPPSCCNQPRGHSEHLVEASLAAYLPGTHSMHAIEPLREANEPGSHETDDLSPPMQ